MFFGILHVNGRRSKEMLPETNIFNLPNDHLGSGRSVAFVHSGAFSHANQSLLAALQRQFAHDPQLRDVRFAVLDLMPIVRNSREILLANLVHVYREFGHDILTKRKSFQRAFYATTYLFRKRSELAARFVASAPRLFSMQTQSLFDASTPGVPHFLYTDHTMLANLHYPDVQSRQTLGVSEKWLRMERSLYNKATANFTMSLNISRSISEDYGCTPAQVVLALAGGNVAEAVVPHHKDYTKKNILFVGMDWARKGGPQLVEAFRRVRRQHPDAQLTVVGCSPPVNLPGCRVVGHVPKAEVAKYYDEATLFCMPTRLEPFGFVFLEAMQHGLPLVATNIGAIPDFLHHGRNGYLSEPNDVDGLANALCRLLDDPQKRQQFGQQSVQMVQPYNWDNVARIMTETIQQHIVVAPTAHTIPVAQEMMQPA
ncbi:MAG: glycosyltransferase family 4 protein [Caldilineaceae bacterium]